MEAWLAVVKTPSCVSGIGQQVLLLLGLPCPWQCHQRMLIQHHRFDLPHVTSQIPDSSTINGLVAALIDVKHSESRLVFNKSPPLGELHTTSSSLHSSCELTLSVDCWLESSPAWSSES